MKKSIAISACLLGEKCRYDANDNKNERLLKALGGHKLIAFCPEAEAFGIPRATMDLVQTPVGKRAISNKTNKDLSKPIEEYAKIFFDSHLDIDLFIGKERSPSCGVTSARLYDEMKNLISSKETGLMAKEAKNRKITCIDAEKFIGIS